MLNLYAISLFPRIGIFTKYEKKYCIFIINEENSITTKIYVLFKRSHLSSGNIIKKNKLRYEINTQQKCRYNI